MWWNGRHACLRCMWRELWGFKSPRRHFLTYFLFCKDVSPHVFALLMLKRGLALHPHLHTSDFISSVASEKSPPVDIFYMECKIFTKGRRTHVLSELRVFLLCNNHFLIWELGKALFFVHMCGVGVFALNFYSVDTVRIKPFYVLDKLWHNAISSIFRF